MPGINCKSRSSSVLAIGDGPPVKRSKPSLTIRSPNAVSAPIKIPRISISCDDVFDDEVFAEANKENLSPKQQLLSTPKNSNPILFPSIGTSPRHALSLNSPTKQELASSGADLHQVVKTLGKGTFGTVILAKTKGKRVAVKLISRRSSLENELNVLNLDHENVTKIHEVIDDLEDCVQYALLVMEYVGQSSLQTILEQRASTLSDSFLLSALIQTARGLKACHQINVIHLDLKPANILVSSRGVCKIADFGCSRKLASKFTDLPVQECLGTPGYQAPEMFCLKKVSRKSDMFSYGIVSWQVAARESNPYPGMHPHTIIYQVVSQDWRPNKEDTVITKFKDIYESCWTKDPTIRPDTDQILTKLESQLPKRKTSTSLRI